MATNEQLVFSDLPVSPGSVLLEEIQARGVTAEKLACLMERSVASVLGILDERIPVTPDIATDIEKALGIKAYLWLNLEAGYRATLAHNKQVAADGANHTCDLGDDCPTRQTYDDDEEDEEAEIPAQMLMDEGE